MQEQIQKATLAGGCFWCIEAVFQRLKGVSKVTSGYSGGKRENPTYEQVSSEGTGHAEVVQLEFDPNVISFEQLLDVFWVLHDPTQLNRQGADVGSQYRSAIFYHNPEQKKIAEDSKQRMEESGTYSDSIVTEISEFTGFYPAEGYHQDYYNNNPDQPYCSINIAPKLKKLEEKFPQLLEEKAS